MIEKYQTVKCEGCEAILKQNEIVMSAEPTDGLGPVHLCKYCCKAFREWAYNRVHGE